MRASARHNTGVAAECLLAAHGYTYDDDTPVADIARAYTGAVMQVEVFAEVKALHKNIISLIKALAAHG